MNIENLSSAIDLDKVLDVTQIEPRLKHPTIFKYFDNLKAGDYFIIHNDHDPKPVYYQLLGERGNIFSFEYLSKGPEDWFIQIQKNHDTGKDAPSYQETGSGVSEKEQKKAAFFASKGEDYSCENGKKVNKKDTVPKDTGTIIRDAPLKDDIILQYDQWNPGFLCDFIEQTDHSYFREQAPQLDDLGENIRLKHQQTHPELASLKMYQDQLFATLLFHLTQEKSALFDAIKQVADSSQKDQEPDTVTLKQLYTGTALKKQANETLAGLLEHIRHHADQYKAPADACDSYIYYFKRLAQLDLRLSRYLHLENTVLLPKISKWL